MPFSSRDSEPPLIYTGALLVLLASAVGWGTSGASAQAVAQPGSNTRGQFDPARNLNAMARLLELDGHTGKDSDAARMMQAYYRGKPTTVGLDGKDMPYAVILGLATCDWTQQPTEGPYTESPLNDRDPFISVDDDRQGKIVGCSPIEVADGLWCDVNVKVINPVHERAHELDFLVGSVSFYGGKKLANATDEPALLRGVAFVDLWSEANSDRLTLGNWTQDGEVRTAAVYGPLLYRVLSSSPEFILIGDRKIALPERFRKACAEICRRVDELRLANGQRNPPAFHKPANAQ
jgi:hypothetical protein